MRTSSSYKSLSDGKSMGSFGVMQQHFKSAKETWKESARRVAEEKGITESMQSMKAKFQGMKAKLQVQGTVAAKRATSTRRSSGDKATGSQRRAKSSGPAGTSVDEELVTQICDLFDSRISQVAARLALSKSRGLSGEVTAKYKSQHLQIACDWLLDEKNVAEIENAENTLVEAAAKREKTATGEELTAPTGESQGEGPLRGDATKAAVKREARLSNASDDGRGLGFFMSRKSFGNRSSSSPCRPAEPSPRKIPMPGRLSRGSCGSARLSTGSADSDVENGRPSLGRRVSMGSQTSGGSEGHPPAMTPRGTDVEDANSENANVQAGLAPCAGDACPQWPPAGGQAGEEEFLEAEEEEEEDMIAPQPPDSTCWDWPLSRHEKKVRVQILEHQMNAMDRQSMKQELLGLRTHLRKMSIGGGTSDSGSEVSRPSRLST